MGAKGVALQTSPATCRYPGVMRFYPGPPEKGGLELSPTRNQTRTEPEFEFSAKRRWSVSSPQLRLRPFDHHIPASRTGGLVKRGRIGRVKESREREKRGERSIKSLVLYRSWHSGQLSSSGDQGQKGPSCSCWVWSIGRQAGPWAPQVVRVSVAVKKSPRQTRHLLQEGGLLPGLETGLSSNTRKWIVQGDIRADKARYFIGKGHPGGE